MDQDFSASDIKKSHAQIKLNELYQWHEECLQEYGQTSSNFRVDLKNGGSDLFVVVDAAPPGIFLEYLENMLQFTGSQIKQFKKLAQKCETSGELFLRINQTLSPEMQARKLGSVDFPVSAEIYQAPRDGHAGLPADTKNHENECR